MQFRRAEKFVLWLYLSRSVMQIWYLLARDVSKQIEAELEYPGQIKVNVIRESRVTDYAK